MPGLGQQRQGVGPDACDNQQCDVRQSHGQRDFQDPRRAARAVNMDVHSLSVRGLGTGFKPRVVSPSRHPKWTACQIENERSRGR